MSEWMNTTAYEEIERQPIVISASGLTRHFGGGKKLVRAVDGVDFAFHRGEIISIVGESGSGKTTIMRMLMGLLSPTGGSILYEGTPLNFRSGAQMRGYWKHVQAVFQDPFSSFNQFFYIQKIFDDCLRFRGLRLSRAEREAKYEEACGFVNLKWGELQNKYPFELSGGQMQRLMIARAFLIEPEVLIADEPTSMIDACSRSTILEMLMKLRTQNRMTIVFITHDLGLAYYVSDTMCIMQKGRFVETGRAEEIINHPQSDYTRHLLSDVPKLHEEWLLAE